MKAYFTFSVLWKTLDNHVFLTCFSWVYYLNSWPSGGFSLQFCALPSRFPLAQRPVWPARPPGGPVPHAGAPGQAGETGERDGRKGPLQWMSFLEGFLSKNPLGLRENRGQVTVSLFFWHAALCFILFQLKNALEHGPETEMLLKYLAADVRSR